MATKNTIRTSTQVATKASKALTSKASSPTTKTLAATALTNAKRTSAGSKPKK